MNNFAIKLKELREEKNLSMSDLGKLLEVSDAAICKWENSVNEPKISYLKKIALFFDVSCDYLLDLAPDDKPYRPVIHQNTSSLTDDEKELVASFRRMPPKLQKIAIDTLHSFAGDRETQQSDDSITIRKA